MCIGLRMEEKNKDYLFHSIKDYSILFYYIYITYTHTIYYIH